MVLIAFLLTWVGAGLLALTAFVIGYADVDGASLHSVDLAAAVHSAPDGLTLPTVLEYYAIAGYAILGGLLAMTTLFTMFNTRANRWIAVIGYVVLGSLIGAGAWLTWGTQDRSSGENVAFFSCFVVAVLCLLFAVGAVKQRIWRAALIGALLALVGLGLSIWLVLSGNDQVSFGALGWLVPVGYFLVFIGAVSSIATGGQARMNEAESGSATGTTSATTPGSAAGEPSGLTP